jgi:hypothetical protein
MFADDRLLDRQIRSLEIAQTYTANGCDQAIFQTDYYSGLEPLKRGSPCFMSARASLPY